MAASEKITRKIILDIDGVLSTPLNSLEKIGQPKWREFIKTNNLHINVGGFENILSPATLTFICYLHKMGFEIFFSSTGLMERNIPLLHEINALLEKFIGSKLLDLDSLNKVYSGEDIKLDTKTDCIKNIAAQLMTNEENLTNVIIMDDTPDNITKGQKRFALHMRCFNTDALEYIERYSSDGNRGDEIFLRKYNYMFQQLNGLYYAAGLIDMAIGKIEEKEWLNIEDVIFELQFGCHHSTMQESEMRFPKTQSDITIYERGLKKLQDICAEYHLPYQLELFRPATYKSPAFGVWSNFEPVESNIAVSAMIESGFHTGSKETVQPTIERPIFKCT